MNVVTPETETTLLTLNKSEKVSALNNLDWNIVEGYLEGVENPTSLSLICNCEDELNRYIIILFQWTITADVNTRRHSTEDVSHRSNIKLHTH